MRGLDGWACWERQSRACLVYSRCREASIAGTRRVEGDIQEIKESWCGGILEGHCKDLNFYLEHPRKPGRVFEQKSGWTATGLWAHSGLTGS